VSRGTQEPHKEDCIFAYRAITFYGRTFQTVRLMLSFFFQPLSKSCFRRPLREELWSYNPELSFRITRFGLFRIRSPLLSESRLISLPPGTEMVHFPGFASYTYEFSARYLVFTPGGLPHSEISGSQAACASPKHIAASYVLHRLIAPRHPHACP
jgi:hypothetical protein